MGTLLYDGGRSGNSSVAARLGVAAALLILAVSASGPGPGVCAFRSFSSSHSDKRCLFVEC